MADAGGERGGATGISFARVNAGEKTRRDYFELNAAGMAAFRSLAAAEGPPPWLHLNGHLEWETTPDRRRRLRERTRLLESWGYPVAVLSGKDVKARLEPDLLVPNDAEVTFFPDEGYVETERMIADPAGLAAAVAGTRRCFQRHVHGNGDDFHVRGGGTCSQGDGGIRLFDRPRRRAGDHFGPERLVADGGLLDRPGRWNVSLMARHSHPRERPAAVTLGLMRQAARFHRARDCGSPARERGGQRAHT